MRVPIVAFQAVTERVEFECSSKKVQFRYNHFREMRTYSRQMERLLQDLDLIRKGPHRIVVEPFPTDLRSGIFAPAVRFITPLLRRQGIDGEPIRYSGLDAVPQLYVDPLLMSHVVFNLLENAVKYYHGPRSNFLVEIVAQKTDDYYTFRFRDYGMGVPSGLGESIFEPGIRGQNAYKHHVQGDGLGLWFVREIVKRHGGNVRLSRHSRPTEFIVELPCSLAHASFTAYEEDSAR